MSSRPLEPIGQRLLLARQAAKLTQKEVSGAVGVTRQALSKWERANSSPGLDTFRDLCALYGVTPAYVLFGSSALHDTLERVMRTSKAEQAAGF